MQMFQLKKQLFCVSKYRNSNLYCLCAGCKAVGKCARRLREDRSRRRFNQSQSYSIVFDWNWYWIELFLGCIGIIDDLCWTNIEWFNVIQKNLLKFKESKLKIQVFNRRHMERMWSMALRNVNYAIKIDIGFNFLFICIVAECHAAVAVAVAVVAWVK